MDRRMFVGNMLGALAAASGLNYVFPDISEAQQRRNGIFTRQVYDDRFNSISNVDRQIASALYPMALQNAVDNNTIPSYAVDFLRPLGIDSSHRTVDFYRGMRMMWDAKKQPRGREERDALRERRNHFLRKMQGNRARSSLLGYRSQEITHGANLFEQIHDARQRSYDDGDMSIFMAEIAEVLRPNALLGYNIQELLPPRIDGRPMNPVAKAWYLDRLFKEAGEEFVEGFPARYDSVMSYGPFQMTNMPMGAVVTRNRYVGRENQVPRYVQQFDGLQDHVNAAVMLAHVNWEQMVRYMKSKPSRRRRNGDLLQEFRRAFDRLGRKEKQIVVAGLTACMHHLPAPTRRRTANYLDRGDLSTMHHGIKTSLNAQLRKYYDSAAEAYLLMKVFDILEEEYGKP